MIIRSFRAGDGPDLASCWTRSAPQDPIGYRRFRDMFLLDRSFDPAGLKIAEVDGTVVGAAYAVRRLIPESGDDLQPDAGWIPFFFVHPDHRGHGVGRQLLQSALDWLADLGRSTTYFSSYTPNYFLPGLDADRYPAADRLLRALGFETQYRCVAMDASLQDYRIPDDVVALIDRQRGSGYRFGPPTDDELVGLIDIAGAEFNADWARGIREAVLDGMPLDRIMMAWDPDGNPLGWAMFGTYEHVIERFGPFGVLPASRGLGLGKVLLHLTLEQMRAAGAHSAWFLWTEPTSAAGRLYLKSGFDITRTFTVMRRTAPSS
ncbi:GNAT family N-acetyltransferase [Microlunatus soli]|nr:GNAT family N-acetyltransferase [Microlunatus soli]